MLIDTGVWLVICCLYRLTTGYCLYGDASDCAFQCHCARDSECSGGVCPSGCVGGPLGHNWRGPACQIGNIGLHKPANMTVTGDYANLYPATAALDGVSPNNIGSNCAHTSDPNNKPAEWWTDLGDFYKIYNITIYARTDGSQKRLQQFNLTVYNRSDNEVLCGYHHDIIKTHSTITCNRPVIGRYVHFKRTGGPEINLVALCEVVIIGHKYIDCSRCPAGVTCTDITGCTQCKGFYRPDCSQKCESGYYGTNCQQQCGHCNDGVTCDNQNGSCHNGCQGWWADNRCQTFIAKPNGSSYNVSTTNVTYNSIEVEWQHLTVTSEVLAPYYGYLIEYRNNRAGDNYIQATTVNNTSSSYCKIENLKSNTIYFIQIKPFRMFDNHKDYGSPYPVLSVKTKCGKPERPQILNVTRLPKMDSLPKIKVKWQDVSVIDAHCDNISDVTLAYKLKSEDKYTLVKLLPKTTDYIINTTNTGEYDVKMVVTNNQGINSSSNIMTISVNELTQRSEQEGVKSSKPLIPVIAGAMAAIVLIVLIIAVTVILLRQRRRAIRTPKNQAYDNESFHVENEQSQFEHDSNHLSPEATNRHEALNHVSVLHNPDRIEKDVNKDEDQSEDRIITETNDGQDTEENLYANSAVAVDSFEGYVARKMAKPKELHDEYKLLPEPDLSRCKVAVTRENKEKNRYRKIFAYDETRVILDGEEKHNYINASYITGYNKKKEYIATQGSTEKTIVDFWRLVWKEKSNRIVMLTHLLETGKKVAPYWPQNVEDCLTIGGFKIKTEAVESSLDYITRIMTVERDGSYRTVRQFHFTTWEDKKRPVYGNVTILAFINKVH